jgi:hypothetical protein
MNRRFFLLTLSACLFLAGCSSGYHKLASHYSFTRSGGSPDYSLLENWAAHPYKKDLSDSLPKPLREGYLPDSTVDVFFIHPTTYTEKEKPYGWNAPVNDPGLAAKTDYSTILYQASIFNEVGRVFSPRYRQAHLSAYFPRDANDSVQAIAAFELAYQDIKSAFLYYLEYDNHGRPIIIASHSQGTTHGKRLIKEFFDGTALQNKLVVAYLVGMPLEPGYFSFIKPCLTPSQTGCTCSWRTYKEGYTPDYIQKEKFISVVTNPLTWDAAIPSASRYQNKGGLLRNFKTLSRNVVNASVHDGVLWTEKPHFFGNIFLTSKNYHIADLNFYYLSIRQNAKDRVAAFRKK